MYQDGVVYTPPALNAGSVTIIWTGSMIGLTDLTFSNGALFYYTYPVFLANLTLLTSSQAFFVCSVFVFQTYDNDFKQVNNASWQISNTLHLDSNAKVSGQLINITATTFIMGTGSVVTVDAGGFALGGSGPGVGSCSGQYANGGGYGGLYKYFLAPSCLSVCR